MQSPSNPKHRAEKQGKGAWYGYHADFSPTFVTDVLKTINAPATSLIVDPWNGTGTTTQVAQDLGLSARGFDLNPVMVIVAKARLIISHVVPSHGVLSRHILKKASRYRARVLEPDPLAVWFTPRAASLIRDIERAVQELLVEDGVYQSIASRANSAALSSLAAFYYLALFRTVRELLVPFRSSNPTWLKLPRRPANRIRPSPDAVARKFHSHVMAMAEGLSTEPGPLRKEIAENRVAIGLADSRSLPLEDSSADVVLSSPPYCTRIDYAVTTRAELAILGYTNDMVRQLRERMIGTSTISSEDLAVRAAWGKACIRFLDAVRTHPSRASSSYYYKNHVQYFMALERSISEIHRVLRPGASCVLVVQDSYYKNIHNDLPKYFCDIARSTGLSVVNRFDYPVKSTLAGLHKHRKTYRTHASATETVLSLAKA